jgi:hypothetical protein
MQEAEKKHEGEARKLVYDPKRGAFVPSKKKGKAIYTNPMVIILTFLYKYPQQPLVKDKKANLAQILMIQAAVVAMKVT